MQRRLSRANELATIGRSFVGAWHQLGAAHLPDVAEILGRYAEPARVYHTAEHVLACLGWLSASGEAAKRPLEVRLALLYHDVVCVPGATDNEARSAGLFRAHANASHLPTAPTERIARMIEATAHHRARSADGALVSDIDLAIFGAVPHEFVGYEAAIREEYRHVDGDVFRAGRERILGSFLESLSIYQTPFFHQRLEAQARTNLARALRGLQRARPCGCID